MQQLGLPDQLIYISLVDCWHAMWNAIFDDIKRKNGLVLCLFHLRLRVLECYGFLKLIPVGTKYVIWERD